MSGFSNSTNGDVTGNHGGYDYWIVKLDTIGTILWQKSLGGTVDERAYSIKQTSDYGYVIGGHTNSNDSDVSGNHSFLSYDFWLVKLDSSGTIEWQKTLGGTGNEGAGVELRTTAQPTSDGGYIMVGMSNSNNGDVTGNHPFCCETVASIDMWIVKLGPDASLPLTLLNFYASKLGKNVKLSWQTASEVNTKDFIIERSADGGKWIAISSINAKGLNYNDYVYYDKNPFSGINYYRLKMNDKDDKFTYTPVRTVEFNNSIDFTIIPNPANNKAELYFNGKVKGAEIVVTDMGGRLLQRRLITEDITTYTIDIDKLTAGTYLIKMQLKTRNIVRKLVVNNLNFQKES